MFETQEWTHGYLANLFVAADGIRPLLRFQVDWLYMTEEACFSIFIFLRTWRLWKRWIFDDQTRHSEKQLSSFHLSVSSVLQSKPFKITLNFTNGSIDVKVRVPKTCCGVNRWVVLVFTRFPDRITGNILIHLRIDRNSDNQNTNRICIFQFTYQFIPYCK